MEIIVRNENKKDYGRVSKEMLVEYYNDLK